MAASALDQGLFEGGPPDGLQRRLGLMAPGHRRVARRAVLSILVGWLPVVVLASVRALTQHTHDLSSIAFDYGLHARGLVATPLLILGEGVCAPYLGAIARQFRDAHLVSEADEPRFERICDRIRRLLVSPVAEIAVMALAYFCTFEIVRGASPELAPAWGVVGAGAEATLTPAGWWYALVGMPLLLALLLGWLWRLAMWSLFLACTARLPLQLVGSHPDHVAGLEFVGHSLRGFCVPAFAISSVAAGRMAVVISQRGVEPVNQKLIAVGAVVGVGLLIFAGPTLLFAHRLTEERRTGALTYGRLADELGRHFERRWLARQQVDDEALSVPDFSATTDLYSVVANVYALRFAAVDRDSLVALLVAMLLPFAPVALIAAPLGQLLKVVKSLLL
jgi:hypothetical protein